MIIPELRVDADGNVAQRFSGGFGDDPRKWIVMRNVDGLLTAFAYTDDEVRYWARLTLTRVSPLAHEQDEA